MKYTKLHTQRAVVGRLPAPPINVDWIALVSVLQEARGIVGLDSGLSMVDDRSFATKPPQQATHRNPHKTIIFPAVRQACETNDAIVVDIYHKPTTLYHGHLPRELRTTDSAGD